MIVGDGDSPHASLGTVPSRTILVLGPHPDLPGGIASVVRTQLESPLAEKYDLRVFSVLREAASKAGLLSWLWRAVTRGFGLFFLLFALLEHLPCSRNTRVSGLDLGLPGKSSLQVS